MSGKQYRSLAGAAYHDECKSFSTWAGVTYYIYGAEICPTTGRAHDQYYVEFSSPKRYSTLIKKFPQLDLEERYKKSTAKAAAEYCRKDGKVTEGGTISKQGERTDLQALCLEVRLGRTLDDVLIENPMAIHQYGRVLQKCEDMYFTSLKRTVMTTCTWYCGPTGCGKSHKAYTENPDAYDYPYDGEWCDAYRGQDTMIINDLRDEIPYSQLLRWVDKWPSVLRVRNCRPRPFVTKHIIITSCKTPEQIYRKCNSTDNIDQLMRRITVVNMKKRSLDLGGM